MYHCHKFKADEVYYLAETELYTNRYLSIGFCPNCNKPVAELVQFRFDGQVEKEVLSGVGANTLMLCHANEIICSLKTYLKKRKNSKPYGWVYGINKQLKNGKIKQYAADFYGNKELIKSI